MDKCARLLGMSIGAFIEAAEKERVEPLRTTAGRYYDRADVRQLAMKLAALAAAAGERERVERMREAVRSLRDQEGATTHWLLLRDADGTARGAVVEDERDHLSSGDYVAVDGERWQVVGIRPIERGDQRRDQYECVRAS